MVISTLHLFGWRGLIDFRCLAWRCHRLVLSSPGHIKKHIAYFLIISLLSACALGPQQQPDLNAKSDEELMAIAQGLDYKPSSSWFKSRERIRFEQSAIEYLGAGRHRMRTPEQEKKILAFYFKLMDKDTHIQAISWALPTYTNHTPTILPKLMAVWEKYKTAHHHFHMAYILEALVKFSSPKYPGAFPVFLDVLTGDEYWYKKNDIKLSAIRGIAAIGLNKKSKQLFAKHQTLLVKHLGDAGPGIKVAIAKVLLQHTGETALPLEILIKLTKKSNQIRYYYYINYTLPVFFRMGNRVNKAAPLLKKMVLSEDGYCPHRPVKGFSNPDSKRKCQEMAAVVLWRIDPAQRKYLIRFFEKGIKNISGTCSAFYLMGKEALPAVPVLERTYRFSSGKLRTKLAFILERLTRNNYPETDTENAPAIIKSLQSGWK